MKNLLAMSLSTICGSALAAVAGTSERVNLARIYGVATDVKHKRSAKYGDSETILGDFRGVDMTTGEESKSSVLYLPRGLQEKILVAIEQNPDSDIRFAYDIWAEPEPKGESYNLGFADLTEDASAPDPLASFAKKLPPMPK